MKRKLVLVAGMACLLFSAIRTRAQTEPPAQDDVVRVFTQLVQTDLMVFDRKGHFVNGLKREDFELKVDGHTNAWVEVPDLLATKLVLSSLMIGERKQASSMRRIAQTEIAEGVNLNVKFRFSPNSQPRFLVFAYNAKSTGGTALPDVAIQIQILRNGQPVVSPPLRTIATQGAADLKRLPYAAELSLEGLERGHYQLRVTVFDRVANTSASEQRAFEIE